jgi:hypothetical protein
MELPRAPSSGVDRPGFANVVGIAAGCVPFGRNADGLPLSVQVMAPAFEDRLVLDVLEALEAAAAERFRTSEANAAAGPNSRSASHPVCGS